jgi:hypothetical protein
MTLSANAFRTKAKYIAMIDADEFIYLPKNPKMGIEPFLDQYKKTIIMKSNVLTNKETTDIVDNNVLDLARYVGEDKYTKTILCTDQIQENEFLLTPHENPQGTYLEKEDIIHYHIFMNDRYAYSPDMVEIDFLKKFMQDS